MHGSTLAAVSSGKARVVTCARPVRALHGCTVPVREHAYTVAAASAPFNARRLASLAVLLAPND
jgi:hypothetical protein